MTVNEYAEKYNLPQSTIYSALRSGRIRGRKAGACWVVDDVPPPRARIKRMGDMDALPDYVVAIIWMNGAIMGDALYVRSRDSYYPNVAARYLRGATWLRGGQTVYKCSSLDVIGALREMGFTGRKDAGLPPPPVEPLAAAQAIIESRCSFGWQLRYARAHPRDKTRAYYVPVIKLCASRAIIQYFVDVLSGAGVIPPRKLGAAANKTSALIAFSARGQLRGMSALLQGDMRHAEFWQAFDAHAGRAAIPYDIYRAECPAINARSTRKTREVKQ